MSLGGIDINKYYFEKYALLSICYLLDLKTQDFEHLDKPDLQSKKLQIGIEVVQAITEHDGLVNSLVNSYFGKGLSGNEIVHSINRENKKGKFKGLISSYNDIAVISDTMGLYNSEKHKKLISEKIREKSRLYRNKKRNT